MAMKQIAILLLVVSFGVAGCDRRPVQRDLKLDHNSMARGPMESSPGAADAQHELQFIDTMIAHHEVAIDAAQLVGTRAQHDELKQLARTVIEDQRREIARLRSWRSEWFGDSPKAVNFDLPGIREGMQGMDLGKLDLLKENAFDLEFIRQMIAHYRGAVTMSKDLAGKETHAELKGLAANIVSSQTAEIEQMRAWEKEWSSK